MMSSNNQRLTKSNVCGHYLSIACKDVVNGFMTRIGKKSQGKHPICINGIIIVFIPEYYYSVFQKIVSLTITPSRTEDQHTITLKHASFLLSQETEWNDYLMKCVGMYCLTHFRSSSIS